MLQQKIEATRALLDHSLSSGNLKQAAAELKSTAAEISSGSHTFWHRKQFPPDLLQRLASVDAHVPGEFLPYRVLLIQNSLDSLRSLSELPVDDSVKLLMCDEYCSFVSADPEWIHFFDPKEYPYRALMGISLCQRFRAGLLDWENAGFPRSWFTRLPRRDVLPVLRHLLLRMGGLRPFWFPHNAFLRGKIQFMREREWEASLLLMAQSMRLQPEVKGVLTGSWFYCPETHRVTPHLAWTTRIFLENGALMSNIGPADAGAGFQQGGKERQELYLSGQYRPTETILLWPRKNILAWLEARPVRTRKK